MMTPAQRNREMTNLLEFVVFEPDWEGDPNSTHAWYHQFSDNKIHIREGCTHFNPGILFKLREYYTPKPINMNSHRKYGNPITELWFWLQETYARLRTKRS